jgi:hypothetical protein
MMCSADCPDSPSPALGALTQEASTLEAMVKTNHTACAAQQQALNTKVHKQPLLNQARVGRLYYHTRGPLRSMAAAPAASMLAAMAYLCPHSLFM